MKGAPFAPRDPIDFDYLHELLDACVNDVIDHYFRAEIIGAEKIPDEGPLIIAPNHSGNAFPYDALVLDVLLWRRSGLRSEAKPRSVYTPMLTAVWWMRPFGLDNWWRRCGAVDAGFDNYDTLLARGERVIHYPEGVPGIGKGFLNRYRLQPFHASFVTLAAKHRAPVFPVNVVNAEWLDPASLTFEPLNRLMYRLLRIPFFPVPTVFLALLFPFFFYAAFPSRMIFVVQDPIDVRALLREAGCEDPDRPDREAALRVAEGIRQRVQQQLDAAVQHYGQKPYDLAGLIGSLRQIRGRIACTTPLGWPFAFIRNDRDRRRPPARNRVHSLLRDLDVWAYYLPFGWPLIALARRLRKPPYGYRGLSKQERREQEGSYLWRLGERPLPQKRPAAKA